MENGKGAKHRYIYEDLKRAIGTGHYGEGDKLPSEAELAQGYNVSRPTVTKALNALKDEGLLRRRTGSGSYVTPSAATASSRSRLIGLIVPDLGKGEIFEPVCAKIAELSDALGFSLLWGGSSSERSEGRIDIEQLARRYVENEVAGVFFAPLEFRDNCGAINRGVIDILRTARVPTVLLDADYLPFPERSSFDLVGIDNFRAGYLVTRRLLASGRRRVDFLRRPRSADTVAIRAQGYRSALFDAGILPQAEWVHEGNPEDIDFVARHIVGSGVEDLVCQNDETAAALMSSLDKLGLDIPERIRLIGFDDVKYAKHLRVPLTTLHQPCDAIAQCAVDLMSSRIASPQLSARAVMLFGGIVERGSC